MIYHLSAADGVTCECGSVLVHAGGVVVYLPCKQQQTCDASSDFLINCISISLSRMAASNEQKPTREMCEGLCSVIVA